VAQVCNQCEIGMSLRVPHVVCNILNILTNMSETTSRCTVRLISLEEWIYISDF
jgi:hypothetical protein